MRKCALLLVLALLLGMLQAPLLTAVNASGSPWNLLDSTMEDYTADWKISQGRADVGVVSQRDGFVNISKSDSDPAQIGNPGPYVWLVPKNGVDLPSDGLFTAEVTLRLAGATTGKPGEISARIGTGSNDTNGKLYPLFVQYGTEGWIAVDAAGTDAVTVDTTVWHNYGLLVNPVAQTYSVFVDGELAISNAAAQTYKGGDLIRLGIDSESRSNMDIQSVRLGAGDQSAYLSAAETPVAPDDVLFQDNFETETEGVWNAESGTWTVSDGVCLQSNNTGSALTYAGENTWSNYEVEVKVTPLSTSKNIAVMLSGRVDGSANRYVGAYNGGTLCIDRRIGGSSKILASKSYTFELNREYTLKLAFSGSRISLYVNGVLELETTDETHASGKIGLATYMTSASFDDVVVRALADTPVSEEPLTFKDFQNYQVVQRNAGLQNAEITVAGTVNGEEAVAVQARVLNYDEASGAEPVVDWTPVAENVTVDTYSGMLTVPQGGWYRLEVRTVDADGQTVEHVTGSGKWGVGINILCIGQSNMVGQGSAPYTVANDLVANYRSGQWSHLADPYDGAGASLVPAMGNLLAEALGLPIGIIPAADSGSGLHAPNVGHAETRYWMYYNTSNPGDANTLYGKALSRARAAGGVELAVWNQGETDGRLMIAEEVYEADMKELLRRFRADLGNSTLPMFLCQIGTHDTNISNDAAYTAIRNAQHDLDDGVNFFLAATEMEFERKDTAHYTTPGLNEIGRRVANSILYYYGESDYYRGPYIVSADYADDTRTVIDVKLCHRGGDDITPESGITGFAVLDGASEVTITSAARLDRDTIRLTLAAAITKGGRVRYLYGLNPEHTNIVKDNTPLALPLENTTQDIPVGDDVIEEPGVWDILDHEMAPQWNSEGFRSSSKVGTITQNDAYVNIQKPNSASLGSEKLYHWLISPAGMALPRSGFTMETTVRLAGPVNGEANEIAVRMGEHSEDLNGQIASVFLGYGESGYISAAANGSGLYRMELDTTQWHTLTLVAFQQDGAYYFDLYVNGVLAFDTVPFQTYKGGDLVRFGADNGGRCDMDVKDVHLGTGAILPEGASSARITGLTLSESSQKETENKTLTVTVQGPEFEDGTLAELSLLDQRGQSVEGITASGIFEAGVARIPLTIPAGLSASTYYVRATVNGRVAVSSAYQVMPDREAPVFPNFEPQGFTIEMEDYLYNPTEEFNFPCVVDTKEHPVSNELGDYRYYLFYAPHDAPAGCCVAASDSLDGPWVEYAGNPVVSKTWAKEDGSGNYYSVSHVSSPHVMWNDVYNCWFMYFHGENTTTRYATSDDLIHWTYGDICVVANDFSPTGSGFNEASYARVFEHEVPGLGNKYIMLLMITGTGSGGHRNIYWAYSDEGREWTAVTTSLLDPTMDAVYQGNFSGPWFMEWEGRYFVICHASSGNMYSFEVGADMNELISWGVFYDSKDSTNPSNAEDESAYPDYGRSGAPCFLQDDDGVWHMFYEGGRRLHANIVHAVAYDALTLAQRSAKEELEAYRAALHDEDYRAAQIEELDAAVDAGKAAIDNAQSEEEVAAALEAAKQALDHVKTDSELREEEIKAAAEAAKAAQEKAEAAQKAAEKARKAAEEAQKAAEEAAARAGEDRTAAEAAREKAEAAQKAAEDAQTAAELAQKAAEAAADAAESSNLAAAREALKAAEEAAAAAESAGRAATSAAAAAQAQERAQAAQKAAEDAQKAAEEAKRKAEAAQKKAEEAAASAAEDRENAERAAQEAEAARAAAEEARKAAEDAQNAAEAARDAAANFNREAAASAALAAEYAQKAARTYQEIVEMKLEIVEYLARAQQAAENAEAAQRATEAAALDTAKYYALFDLANYANRVDTGDYNQHQLDALQQAVENGQAAIDAAATKQEVADALTAAKAAVDGAAKLCGSARFTDVNPSKWYHEAIDFVVAKGLMNGVSDTVFAPNGAISRAMLVTVLYRLAGSPETDGAHPFADVQADRYYGDAVAWAYQNRIITGKTESVFDPNGCITREQAVTMLYRYAKTQVPDLAIQADLSGYTDAQSISNYARAAMGWAVSTGILQGKTATELVPGGNAARAELAAILTRFSQNVWA